MEDAFPLRWMCVNRTVGKALGSSTLRPTSAALLLLSVRLRTGKGSSRPNYCFALFFETSYFLRFIFNLSVFLCACVHAYMHVGAYRTWKSTVDPQKLQIQEFVSHHLTGRNQTQVLCQE